MKKLKLTLLVASLFIVGCRTQKPIVITEYQVEGSDSDVLAKAFINGMKNVFSYRGNSDTNNLHLNFKEGELTKYMSFTILRE